MIPIRRVGDVAARIPDPRRDDAGPLADEVLHPPEAPAGENRLLELCIHGPSVEKTPHPASAQIRLAPFLALETDPIAVPAAGGAELGGNHRHATGAADRCLIFHERYPPVAPATNSAIAPVNARRLSSQA